MKFFIRLLILFVTIYFVLINVFANYGIDISDYSYVLILEFVLYQYVREQKNYHCRNMRYLCLGVLITESFTYLDSKINMIPDVDIFLGIISFIWVTAILCTTYGAVKHFIKIQNLKRLKQKNERQKNNRRDSIDCRSDNP